ncbi:MAG: anthranilate synthase component II [Candidatus Cyclobacteriaceae bacterium M3_2C_046]
MKILVLDNYDSFTYNLVHMIKELGFGDQMEIYRNDKIDLEQVNRYDKIMLSPGPGIPEEAGIMPELIRQYGSGKSILGVCLGHQAVAEAYGARLLNMPKVLHGIANKAIVLQNDELLFQDVPDNFLVCRYHSWTVVPESVNGDLEITARDEENHVLAIRHKHYDVRGVQFHPESILTEHGMKMIDNWLRK